MSEKRVGLGVSEGLASAKAYVLQNAQRPQLKTSGAVLPPEEERKRLMTALDSYRKLLREETESADPVSSEILKTHGMLLDDPELAQAILQAINVGKSAENALSDAFSAYIALFEGADNDLTRSRAQDLRDTKNELLQILSGGGTPPCKILQEEVILAAKEVPASFLSANRAMIAGIVSENGGINAHTAIICRSLGIPAVFGVKDAGKLALDGSPILVDGTAGEVIFSPTDEEASAFMRRKDELLREKELDRAYIDRKTLLKDGSSILLFANTGGVEDALDAFENGAEGIGLFRSEFLFLSEASAPDEEKQAQIYRKILLAADGKPVTVRTLDVGGDKEIPYLDLPKSDDPFLGVRGIRYTLENRDLFKTQLRALLRAAHGCRNLNILLPMVSIPEEIRATRELLCECESELRAEAIPYSDAYRLGVMIETPAAVLSAEELAKNADFFSIGTNDLIQYVMAAERTDEKVAYLYSADQPAVLRAIRMTVTAAHDRGIPVSVCGEAAADPALLPFFLGIGIDELSVSGRRIPSLRRRIAAYEPI